MSKRIFALSVFMGVSTLAAQARAGTVTAYFDDPNGIDMVYFDSSFATGQTGGASSAIVNATRQDSPGPGVDTLLPTNFRVFCVEVGQDIFVPQTSTFADVVLLSSHPTTNPGPYTGPVVFDATRTANIEKLFGSFYPNATDSSASDAFQLALWELAFDDDLSLTQNPSDPNDRMWVDPSNDPNPSVTAAAQGFLNAIAADTNNLLPEAELALLTDPTIQDQLALIPVNPGNNVPEPASLALIAPAGLMMLRRRRVGR